MPAPILSRSPSVVAPLPIDAGPPSHFSWTRRAESAGSIRLILAGELDLAARGHLESALDDAQADSDRVLLDLRALTLIDCAALAVLYSAARRSERERASMILLDPCAQVRRMLDLVGPPPGVAILDRDDVVDGAARVSP